MADVQIPVGDNTIWRGYAKLVKQLLIGSNNLQPGLDYLYVCPPTERGIRGGRAIPDPVTNFNIFSAADSLQRADSPLFMIRQDLGYFDSLKNYLNAVQGKIVTDQQKAEIKEAIKKLREAEDEKRAEKRQALADWRNDPQAEANHIPFQRWAIENADAFLQLEEQVNLASGQVDQLQSRYYGAVAATLREKKEKLEELAGSQYSSNPGFNMPCFIGDYAINDAALNAGNRVEDIDARDLVYEPLYAIDGYEAMCDSWIRGDAGDGLVSTVDFNTFAHDDWTDFGHSKSSSRHANSFFYFFSKSSSSSTTETHLNFNSSDWRSNTRIEVTMHGYNSFNITPGLWDDAGVRRTFPTLLEGETDTALGLVRVSKILVAHRVSVKIYFAESLRTQVRNMVSQAKSESNGALRIFGFQFGRDTSSGSSFYRDLNSVQYDEATGVLTLPETPRGCPILLGVLGRKIGA